jgi:hypothetical protein
LRRIATKKFRESHKDIHKKGKLSKNNLLQYVDDAIQYGHNCSSKRGRKRKSKIPSIQKIVEVPKKEEPIIPTLQNPMPIRPFPCIFPISPASVGIHTDYAFQFPVNPQIPELTIQPREKNLSLEQNIIQQQNLLAHMQREINHLGAMQQQLIYCLAYSDGSATPSGSYQLNTNFSRPNPSNNIL